VVFRVQGSGFRMCLGFKVQGSECGWECGVEGLGRVKEQGSGVGV
jgi:hypothetical protein